MFYPLFIFILSASIHCLAEVDEKTEAKTLICPACHQLPRDRYTIDEKNKRILGISSQSKKQELNNVRTLLREKVVTLKFHELNPQDASDFCPNYSHFDQANKQSYWVDFMMTIIKYESNFRHDLTYEENFTAKCTLSSGRILDENVISRGLFQVSACSCDAYGIKLNHAEELNNPEKNIECASTILKSQISRHKVIRKRQITSTGSARWLGASSYWAVFRNKKKYEKIKALIKSIVPACYSD